MCLQCGCCLTRFNIILSACCIIISILGCTVTHCFDPVIIIFPRLFRRRRNVDGILTNRVTRCSRTATASCCRKALICISIHSNSDNIRLSLYCYTLITCIGLCFNRNRRRLYCHAFITCICLSFNRYRG